MSYRSTQLRNMMKRIMCYLSEWEGGETGEECYFKVEKLQQWYIRVWEYREMQHINTQLIDFVLFLWRNGSLWRPGDILSCHSRKCAALNINMNNGWIPLSCFSFRVLVLLTLYCTRLTVKIITNFSYWDKLKCQIWKIMALIFSHWIDDWLK